MADYAQMFQDIGGAASDLFSAQGANRAAGGYDAAAQGAYRMATYAQENTNVQEMMAGRKLEKTLGGQMAEVAAAGFTEGGSALDLLRDSTTQGALTKQLIGLQGGIQTESYNTQAQAYIGEKNAAEMASKANTAGGILKGLGAIFSLF